MALAERPRDYLLPLPADAPTCCPRVDTAAPDAVRQSDGPCRVRPGLYIGGAEAERVCYSLPRGTKERITHVLQVGSELTASHARRLVYKRLPVSDLETEDLVAFFEEAFRFIDLARTSGGAVLVHCAQGVSRSATLVAGYLMWAERLGADAAVGVVRAARACCDPNEGFRLQLREFGEAGCDLAAWRGWGHASLQRSLRRNSASGRRVVHTYSDIIRRFHTHSLTDDDTVFCEHDTILAL